jgi:hypothetical protein
MRFAENSRFATPQKRAKFTSGLKTLCGQSAQNSARRRRMDRDRVAIPFQLLRPTGSVENPASEKGTGTFLLHRLRKNEPVPGGVFNSATPGPVRRGFTVNGITSSGCAGIVALGRSCYIDGLPNRAFDRLPVLAAGLEGRPFFGGRVSFQGAICSPRHFFGGTASGEPSVPTPAVAL